MYVVYTYVYMLDGWETAAAAATKITDNGHGETTSRDVRRVSRRFSREPVYTGAPYSWSSLTAVACASASPRGMKYLWFGVAVGTLAAFACVGYACNEAVCASIVSKCMITQSCKCDLANCSCCKECFSCLNNLYSECCSCVGECVVDFGRPRCPTRKSPCRRSVPDRFISQRLCPPNTRCPTRRLRSLPASTTPFVVYDPDVSFCRRRNGVRSQTPDNNVRRARKVNFEDESRRFSHLRRCHVESFICHVARYYGDSFRTVCCLTVVISYVVYNLSFTIHIHSPRSGPHYLRIRVHALASTCYFIGKFKLLKTKIIIIS